MMTRIACVALALCASLATASLAHEGHDHGDADKAPPIVGNQPQRLADGTVFIPKSAQRGMGVLTLKAASETVARSLELPGRVIMDPHLGGRVQAMQPGRIESAGPHGLPAAGSRVKKGEVLFTIDDRTYRAALEQAQATLARAKTQASLAQSEANRTDKLVNTNVVSREEWEQRRSAATQAQADIRAAQAAVDAAQLNLDFTKVTAPIDGRASRALITSGNLVTAGDTASVLTTLVSQKTVYVYFDVDESTYLHYQNLARSGQGASSNHTALPVEIGLTGEEGYPHQGKVDFLDNQLTPSTGTIRMRALLDNAQRQFTPGLFARVRLPGSAEFKATLIDDKAVLTDQDRKYVYIVDKEGKAQRRDITPGRLADGLRIVRQGLNPGDKVIVEGLQKVFMPGMPVNAKTVAMTATSALN